MMPSLAQLYAKPLALFQRIALAAALCGATLAQAASVAPVAAENGMVVTAQHLATQVGVQVLKEGGNAVDAAIAVSYALAVVYPGAGNLGGGGFMTLTLANGQKHFLDFREKAPLAATPNMFLGADGNPVPNLSTKSHLAVGVPGSVHGMETARERWGTWPRERLLAPAIALAEHGFVLQEGDAQMFRIGTPDLRKDAASAAIFLNQGQPWEAGQTLVQRDLAKTLRLISERGNAGFYKGPVAQALVAASKAGGGLITQADLDQYRSREMQPVQCRYRGYEIVSAPPPSSGGLIICHLLQVLEAYPLRSWGFRSAKGIHVQIEALRHAYVQRNFYLGDPDYVSNPSERLLSAAFAQRIREAIDPSKAALSSEVSPGKAPHEGSNTTHYSIADQFGNAVSVTTTLNEWFGTRITVPGTGVLLNNEMDDFTVKPGVPNLFGLVQGATNAIAPGKRPLSSMSPTIVLQDAKPRLVLGSPGGSRIITAVLHTLLNFIDYGMNIQEAVDAPRFHHQWLPDLTNLEAFAMSPDTIALLQAMGHKLSVAAPPGHVAAIAIGTPAAPGGGVLTGTPTRNRFFGANDPRRNTGLALGH